MTAGRAFIFLAAMASALPAMAQTRTSEAGRTPPRADRDGIVINQFDTRISRQTFWSDGRSATQFGSIVIYNDGTMATRSGERTIFGTGRSCGQFGATTLCD